MADTNEVIVNLFQSVTANLSGGVRREKFNDRSYLVAPLTLIVPGVLNGSDGPLLYPEDEQKRDPSAWNHMPIVVPDHPTKNGKPVSARDPEILAKYGVGFVFRANYSGKTVAEGWFDEEHTKRIDKRVYNALIEGKPLELSTGLFLSKHLSAGVFNGVDYTHVARDYRPDHLAVFADKIGACSNRDGCGVLVNTDNKGLFSRIVNAIKTFSTLGDEIKALEQLSNNDNKEPPVAKLSDQDRKVIIDNLIGNCDCSKEKPTNNGPWSEEDRDLLSKMTDDRLNALETNRKQATANASFVANARKGLVHDGLAITVNAAGQVQVEKKPPADDGLVDNLDIASLQPGDSFERVAVGNGQLKFKIIKKGQPPVTTNKTQAETEKEWWDRAPARVRAVVQNAFRIEDNEKKGIVESLLNNARNTMSREQLESLPLEDGNGQIGLRTLAQIAGVSTATQNSLVPNYLGAAPAPSVNLGSSFKNEDHDMATPVVNWGEKRSA